MAEEAAKPADNATAASTSTGAATLQPLLGLANCTLLQESETARVYKVQHLGQPAVLKQRLKEDSVEPPDRKPSQGTLKAEVRGLVRARKVGVSTPVLYLVDQATRAMYMEEVQGGTVRNVLQEGCPQPLVDHVADAIGKALARLHDGGAIHGDISTSHMLLKGDVSGGDAMPSLLLCGFSHSYNCISPEDRGAELRQLELDLEQHHKHIMPDATAAPAAPATEAASPSEGAKDEATAPAVASSAPEVPADNKSKSLFGKVVASYRKYSRNWSATFNRYAMIKNGGAGKKRSKPEGGSPTGQPASKKR